MNAVWFAVIVLVVMLALAAKLLILGWLAAKVLRITDDDLAGTPADSELEDSPPTA